MVLYRTVFEILTPKVWNIFIESPDIYDIYIALNLYTQLMYNMYMHVCLHTHTHTHIKYIFW